MWLIVIILHLWFLILFIGASWLMMSIGGHWYHCFDFSLILFAIWFIISPIEHYHKLKKFGLWWIDSLKRFCLWWKVGWEKSLREKKSKQYR